MTFPQVEISSNHIFHFRSENIIIIALFILGLKTSNIIQQFKYKNDIKKCSTAMLKK